MMTLGLVDAPLLATWLTMDALIFAIAIYDWRTLGKITSISIIGALVIILPEVLYIPITRSETFFSLLTFLGDLAYYR